jgi:CheY-like chemotaxis protein
VPAETVLVVDDDADIRGAMALVLREDGFNVEEAADGHEALALLRSHPSEVRLVFLDLAMPGMDGRAFLRAKRADPLIVNVPVVVVTGDPSQRVGPAGAVQQYLTKPLSLAGLLQAARDSLGTGPSS